MNKAIFINKNGTLITGNHRDADPDKITLEHGVAEGLAQLKKDNYLLITVSNEAGIAHGYFKEPAMVQVQKKILQLLHPFGITINGFYYCPHHPQGSVKDYSVRCFCRKPQPGLLLRAAKDFDIDLSKSWMVGSLLDDVEAGNKSGCKTVLINDGSETEWLMNDYRLPAFEVSSFKAAASYITHGIDQVNIGRRDAQRIASV